MSELLVQVPDDALLEQIGLPIRLLKALTNEGLRTVGDIRDLSDVNLRCVRRIGSDSFRVLREMFGPSRQHRGRFECHKVFRLRRALPCSREACGSGNRGEPGEVGPSYCG